MYTREIKVLGNYLSLYSISSLSVGLYVMFINVNEDSRIY